MMIPKIIKEIEKRVYDDGSYVKQYLVHAPEWNIYLDNHGHSTIPRISTSTKIDHFLISESTRMGYVETLVFPCEEDGQPDKWLEAFGGRGYVADEILVSFGLHMMEAGYDTV